MIIQTVSILLETTSGQNFSKTELYLGEYGPQPPPPPPKKRPSMDSWISSTKNSKNFELHNYNCYTDKIYHKYVFHFAKSSE